MNDPATGGDKQALRRSVLAGRLVRSAEARSAAAEAMAAHLLASAVARAPRIAAYLSFGTEPGTEPLIAGLLARGADVIVPVTSPDANLDWVRHEPGDTLTTSSIGVPEPTGPRLGPDALATVGLVVVPALAVDHAGWRLGRGAGYFDRALVSATAPICALVYGDELVHAVPHEPHDVRVQLVVTDAGLFRVP